MSIDRITAIKQLSRIKVRGDEDGLIDAFGVLVNFLPANFWNSFTEKLLKSAGKTHYREVEAGLYRAANECGYHTGWGIINSEEFKSIIGPMIEKMPEDVLHGAFAVLTAWGWAETEITELIPGERMTVRVKKYYESEIMETYKLEQPGAFMVTGICAAFMDLAYGSPYPEGLGTFKCEQRKGIEIGDPFGEFIVTRK
jgi:hypothetical protein